MVIGGWSHRAQLGIIRHSRDQRPPIPGRHAHDLDNLLHLVPLKRDGLLIIHLRLLSLENRPQGEQLGEDAPDGPQVDGGRVVVGAEDQLWRTVPYRHDNLVAAEERGEGLVEAARETEITNLDASAVGDHDVGGFQVSVQDPGGVEVVTSIEKLEQQTLDDSGRDGPSRPGRLCRVMMNDLQQIVLGVLKDHEDALVLEQRLHQANDVGMAQLRAETHLADGRLRDARVADLLALLVGLELLDGDLDDGFRPVLGGLQGGGAARRGLVDAAVGAAADEADDAVALGDAGLGLIARGAAVVGIW